MDVWESDVAPQLLTDRTLAGDAAPVASEHWREREATPGACGGGLRGRAGDECHSTRTQGDECAGRMGPPQRGSSSIRS